MKPRIFRAAKKSVKAFLPKKRVIGKAMIDRVKAQLASGFREANPGWSNEKLGNEVAHALEQYLTNMAKLNVQIEGRQKRGK